MRKLLVGAVLMAGAVGVLGQIPQPYLSLLPGTTLNAQHERSEPYPWLTWDRDVKTGFLGSVEGGFPMTRFVGVHFAYLGTSQDFTLRQYVDGRPYGTGMGTAPVNILEIGPEFTWCPSTNQQIYAQLNMGHTLSSETVTTTYVWPYTSYHRTEHFRDNAWALGLTLGYRGYFSKSLGVCVQATYHHVSGWSFSPIWAAQVGVTFRF